MWIFVAVFMNIILQLNLVHSQSLNDNTGPIDLHVKIGTVPAKYQVLDENDLKASQKVAIMAEMMRPAFPIGFGPMPPLDPYKKKDIDVIAFNIPHFWLSGKVHMKNLVVTGAQQFALPTFQLRLKDSRTDAVINVPHLAAEVDFEVSLTFGLLPLVFGGHLRIVLTDVSVAGALGAGTIRTSDNRQVFQLSSADVYAHAQNIQIDVTRFHIGDGMELDQDFSINHWINELKDDIALTVVKAAMNELNVVLKTYTVDQVRGFLLS